MSLLEDLADQLRTTGEHLPIAEVTAATERLRMAGGLLAWVMHSSTNPGGVPTMAAATEHLEHAAGAMLVAQEALRDYALTLGLSPDAVPADDRRWHTALAPTPPPAPPTATGSAASPAPELSDWWAERVGEITEGTVRAAGAHDAAQTSADLLHRCTASALDDDRDRLRRELAGAGPAVGLGLAAVAPPLIRYLAAELVGHPPRIEDLATVRRAALPRVAPLLPGSPPAVAEELIARACHAQQQRTGGAAPHHPVDAAAAGAVLVAALLRATGRGADDLAQVTEELRRRTEDDRVRSTLRLAEAEALLPPDTRRAPAVEALLASPARDRAAETTHA